MDADIVGDKINNLDLNTVALSSDDPRAGKLAIDSQDGLGLAQSCHILQSYLQKQPKKGINIMIRKKSIFSYIVNRP